MKAYEIQTNLDALQSLAEDINQWAVRKGFQSLPQPLEELCKYNQEVGQLVTQLVKSQKIALIHSEASELLEGLRKPSASGAETFGFTNEEEEAADILIRLLNYCGQFNLRIGAATGAKMAKNENRPFKHGKQF